MEVSRGSSDLTVITHCVECHTPSTRPRIRFNSSGICNACVHANSKQETDWNLKEIELRTLVGKYQTKSATYDCIIPVSGGKDSHYQAYYAKEVLGLRPLCATVRPLLPTAIGQKNLANLIDRIGVDHILLTPNPETYAYLSRIHLEKYGDPYKPFLLALFSGIARIANEKKIPLFLYGENGETEYGGSSEPKFNKLDTQGVIARVASDRGDFIAPDKWADAYGLHPVDTLCYTEPTSNDGFFTDRIFMADYVPWNNNHHLHVALNVIVGFTLSDKRTCGTYTHGSGLDDMLDEIYLWMTWPKFGYGRATKYASKDIREGKLSSKKAIELIRLYDGEFPLHVFDEVLNTLKISEEIFWQIVERHVGDEQNIKSEIKDKKLDASHTRPVAWEKIGDRRWRLIRSVHGEERILELPMKRA